MAKKTETEEISAVEAKPKCGIIMPISPIDGCSADHWQEILSIIKDVAVSSGFEPNLVSDADDIGIIQKRIIQNVYSNDIVVCDVSGKNPNVMFELGMRLAFDKATVIIKDDKTDYSFDTGVIEHLGYPRDLRFHKILEFKENLKKKLESTHKKSVEDPNYSTFLKNFGEYKIAHLQEKEITSENFILNSLDELKQEMRILRHTQIRERNLIRNNEDSEMDVLRASIVKKYIDEYVKENNIKRFSHLADSMDELYEYLESQSEIRKVCGHSRNIRRAIDRALS